MGVELQVEIIRNHLTIKDIAEQVGLSVWALSRRMNGTSEFKVSELRAIKKALNLSNERFVEIFFN